MQYERIIMLYKNDNSLAYSHITHNAMNTMSNNAKIPMLKKLLLQFALEKAAGFERKDAAIQMMQKIAKTMVKIFPSSIYIFPLKLGAEDRTRTGTTFVTAPSRRRVYQFHHFGTDRVIFYYQRGNKTILYFSVVPEQFFLCDLIKCHFLNVLPPDWPYRLNQCSSRRIGQRLKS